MIPFGGVGLLAALRMKELKLETVTDEVCKTFLYSVLCRGETVDVVFCIAMGHSEEGKVRRGSGGA